MKPKFLIKRDFKKYLKEHRYRVNDLATLLNYKESQVSAILNRKIEPSMRFLHTLCSKLQVGIGEVVETVAAK